MTPGAAGPGFGAGTADTLEPCCPGFESGTKFPTWDLRLLEVVYGIGRWGLKHKDKSAASL
jgi:hypothetical protein